LKSIYRFLCSFILVIMILSNIIILGISCIVYAVSSYSLSNIPEFSTVPYIMINNNEPMFENISQYNSAFESYSELDALGRCGPAFALVCIETMPTDSRESISSVYPTGWVQNQYATSLVEGGYIYNRCHLIGWQLTGENANKKNLITGTRYLNIKGMLDHEDMVAEYVKTNNGHVLYRVTPIFENDNLLASGVLMEGYSVDDSGTAIKFCIYCYNVQPGITINYKTGANTLTVEIIINPDGKKYIFILNTKTMKVHLPECSSVKEMTVSSKKVVSCTVDSEALAGYSQCSRCKAIDNKHLAGDVDKTSGVTVSDARLILRFAIKLDVVDPVIFYYADSDASGTIDVSDARLTLRVAIGLD